jgi:RHS repeat-associated protein
MRFAGEYEDTTGLYHLRARQYDPSVGRFTALDPLPNPVKSPYMSAYVYANDRPTVLTDPSGLRPHCTSLWCFLKSIPGTVKCEVRHPGHTAAVVASWSVAVGLSYGGWRLGAAIASSKAPGLLAEISHPAHVAMPVAGKWLLAAASGGIAYEQSKELARICSGE